MNHSILPFAPFLARAAAITAGLSLAASPAGADWYGGDPAAHMATPLAAFHWATNAPTPGYQAFAYDNFVWTNAGGGMVSTLGGYYSSFAGVPITGVTVAGWQIRSGMSPGVGGTLVASGIGAPVTSSTPFMVGQVPGDPPNHPIVRVDLDVPDFALAPGNYWLAVSIGDAGANGGGFVAGTTGANSIGTGINDGQSIYFQGDNVSPNIWNYADVATTFGPQTDLAYFITEVPPPGAAAVLGLGALVATRRRRA